MDDVDPKFVSCSSSPTVASWELAFRIRDRRRELGLEIKDVAIHLGVSRSYLSAIENARRTLTAEKFYSLLKLFRIDGELFEEFKRLRAEASKPGKWSRDDTIIEYTFIDELVLHYLGLEAGSSYLRSFECFVVSGLLQSEEYATALISSEPMISSYQVERRVKIRKRRQQIVFEEGPKHTTIVLNEASLNQQIGGLDVLSGQLRHILKIVDTYSDKLTLRIICGGLGATGALYLPTVSILSFSHSRLPKVVWRETLVHVGLTDDPSEVASVELDYDLAIDQSLTSQESYDLVAEKYENLKR